MRRLASAQSTHGGTDNDDILDNIYIYGCAERLTSPGVSFHKMKYGNNENYQSNYKYIALSTNDFV
jgi:hypothetical protein